MAHAASRRRCAARNKAHNRLFPAPLGFINQELRRLFLGRSADFADHHNRMRCRISKEHFEHIDEFGALHRVTANAHRRCLAEAFLRRLEHRLISQRARTRHNADIARLENIARHDTDLAGPRRHDTRTVRPDQA